MRIGVVFPQTEIGPDKAIVRDYAQAAEGAGYDHLLAYDHVLGANPERPGGWQGPYTYKHQFHEPFVLFGYLAGVAPRLELVTDVIIAPQRQTVLLAKQAAEVDVVTGGKFRLGLGIGWNAVEYEALNEDFHTRGRRVSEQIALMRRLWTEELVTFKGRWHSIPDAGLNPLPVQRPIPIWMGGMSEQALKRMGRLADGWFPLAQPGDTLKGQIERLRGYAREAGRDPAAMGIEGRLDVARVPREQWAEAIGHWQELGATHLSFNTMNAGYTSPQQHIDAIRQFRELTTTLSGSRV